MTHFENARRIAKLLDSRFSLFGFKFGIEPLIGLMPGLGDTLTLFLSSYIVYTGISMKLPRAAIIQMMVNVGIDYLVGIVPIIGDLGDFMFKANDRNIKILEKFKDVQEGEIIH